MKREKVVLENPFIRVKQFEIETTAGFQPYTYIERQVCLIVIPLEEQGEDKRVLLVHEFRPPNKRRFWQFPMGGLPEGEDAENHAKKELSDETGIRAEKIEKIGEFFIDPGLSTQKGIVLIASSLTQTEELNREVTEDIEGVAWKNISDIKEMVKVGKIDDAWTICALSFLRNALGNKDR